MELAEHKKIIDAKDIEITQLIGEDSAENAKIKRLNQRKSTFEEQLKAK
jgi:hypothetical protein